MTNQNFSVPTLTEQLQRIETELNNADIPKEVWIGTDSTADRVTWLITRNQLNQQNSRSRHKTIEMMSELIETALETVKDSDWQEKADVALIRAGRRQA